MEDKDASAASHFNLDLNPKELTDDVKAQFLTIQLYEESDGSCLAIDTRYNSDPCSELSESQEDDNSKKSLEQPGVWGRGGAVDVRRHSVFPSGSVKALDRRDSIYGLDQHHVLAEGHVSLKYLLNNTNRPKFLRLFAPTPNN